MANSGRMSGDGRFYGIGVGPGDPELLTVRAVAALKSSDYIFEASSGEGKDSVAGNIARHYAPTSTQFIPLIFPMTTCRKTMGNAWADNAAAIAEKVRSGAVCSFVTIGDPMLYSTCSYLLKYLRGMIEPSKIEIIPGITSFQALASKSLFPLGEGEETISIMPAFSGDAAEIIEQSQSDVCVIMKPYKNKNQIAELASKHGYQGVYGAKVCLDNQCITDDMQAASELPVNYLCLFILRKSRGHGEF